MKHILIIFFLSIMVTSCNFFRAPGKDKCDKIISVKKMTDILEDIYLLEAYLLNAQSVHINRHDSMIYYFGGVFEKHGVTKWEFEMALNCYLLNEKDMLIIHDEILQRFSLLQSKAEQIIAQEEEVKASGTDTVTDVNEYQKIPDYWHLGIPKEPEPTLDSLLFLREEWHPGKVFSSTR
jgi:hypothetical protein